MGRTALGKVAIGGRVNPATVAFLNELAISKGMVYGQGGAIGQLLDAIAAGDYVVVPKTSYEKLLKKKVDSLGAVS
jgi:hypothetical protein